MVSSTADRDTRRKSRVALGHERELLMTASSYGDVLTSECGLVEAELRREPRLGGGLRHDCSRP